MRSPFRSFHALVLALFGAIAYQLLSNSEQWAKIADYGSYVLPGIVISLWLLFTWSRTITDKLLEWMPWVRRMYAGHGHIEGDWPLVVVEAEKGENKGKLRYYGFLTIKFKDGQYEVSGTDWKPDGSHALDFNSMQSYQMHPALHYWYRQGEGGRQRGYTFIEFFPRDRVPERHTGVFHDPEHLNVRFYARKLKYRRFQRRLRDMEPRRQAAKAFADEIMEKMPKMIEMSVDADWG